MGLRSRAGQEAGIGGARMAVGVASALAGALLWGFSGACAQFSLSGHEMTPLFITAVRTALAAVLLMALSLWRYRPAVGEMLKARRMWWQFALFGIGLFLSQSTFAMSVSHTNAGTATVLQSLSAVFVMVCACVAARRLPHRLEVAALLCALASTWLIATQGDWGKLNLPAAGLVWGIVNASAVALYLTVPKRLYGRWPSIPVISCGMAVAAVVALVCWMLEAACTGGTVPSAVGVDGWLVLVGGIGVLGTACAFGLYLYGASVVGAVKGSLLGAAEPASAMVLTVLWLGTSVTPADWLGLGCMVATIALVSLQPAPRQ